MLMQQEKLALSSNILNSVLIRSMVVNGPQCIAAEEWQRISAEGGEVAERIAPI